MKLSANSIEESSNDWRIPREVSTCAPNPPIHLGTKFREEGLLYMQSSEMKAGPPGEKNTYYRKYYSKPIIKQFDKAFRDKTKQYLFFDQKFKPTDPYFFDDQPYDVYQGRLNTYDPPEDADPLSNFDDYFCHAPPNHHEVIKSYPLQNQTGRAKPFAYEGGYAPKLHLLKLRSCWIRVLPNSTKMNGLSSRYRSSSNRNKYCDYITNQSTIRLRYLPKCTIPKNGECNYTYSRVHAQINWLAHKIPVPKFRNFNFTQLIGLKLACKISLHRLWKVTRGSTFKLQSNRVPFLQCKKPTFDFLDRRGFISRFILHHDPGSISGKKRCSSSLNLNKSLRHNFNKSQTRCGSKQSYPDALNSKSIFNSFHIGCRILTKIGRTT